MKNNLNKYIFLLIVVLSSIAIGVFFYEKSLPMVDMTYLATYYKATNLAIVILILFAFARKPFVKAFKEILASRASKYEESVDRLAETTTVVDGLSEEKRDLNKSFQIKRKETLKLIELECEEILQSSKEQIKKIDEYKTKRLEQVKQVSNRKAQLLLLDKVIEKAKLELKQDIKPPDENSFDDLLKIIKT